MAFLTEAANRGSIATGYDIENSCKFEADNAEKMTHTYDSAPTSQKKGTISLWFKRTEIGSNIGVFQFGDDSSGDYLAVRWGRDIYGSGETYRIRIGGSTNITLDGDGAIRDTSAWYHMVIAIDTTQATASNRFRVYRNGAEVSMSTDNRSSLTQNTNMAIGENGKDIMIGEGVYKYNGYIAEVNYVDGQQLTPSDFGEYDSDSGIWIPKKYTGTYGNNGFYLDFKNASNLGEDQSGNNHDFTLSNITSANQATDTPTNNFCTWLSDGQLFSTSSTLNISFNEGGTNAKGNTGTGWVYAYSTQAASSGKWYYEGIVGSAKNCMIGACPVSTTARTTNAYLGQESNSTVGFQYSDGNIFFYTGYTTWESGGLATGDIVGFAMDLDNGKAYVSRNGTWFDSANPATNYRGLTVSAMTQEPYMFAMARYNPNQDNPFNFGGYTTISISSGESDENGYGNFEYAPPSGYYALCTKNLAEYG